jgi:hypothetical protein
VLINIFGGITRCDDIATRHSRGLQAHDHQRARGGAPDRHQRRGGLAIAEGLAPDPRHLVSEAVRKVIEAASWAGAGGGQP